MWTTRTSRPPHKFPKWTPRWIAEAMPLVEWALTPMGHCKPKEEYTRVIASTYHLEIILVIASTYHLEIICFVTGLPLVRLPKPTKSCSDFLYEAERSMYTLRALTGQNRDNSWLPVEGESAESTMTWALNWVEYTLGTVMSGRPVGVTFPNQFPLGNPENVSGKLEIHFDDLIVESIQRKTFREIQKRRKAERRKRAKKRDGSSKDNQPDQENCFIDA